METESPRNKIDAIYELRQAVEAKAHAEHELAAKESPAARDALLEAQLEVEAKTQDAIDVCHECGDSHPAQAEHVAQTRARPDNVVHVEFRPGTRTA
jgi:hypothetical protein